MATVRDRIQRAARRGAAKVVRLLGVYVTYRWYNASTKTFSAITNLKMLRAGKATTEESGEFGSLTADGETYTINQDALKVGSTIVTPTIRDQIVDEGKVYEVVDFNRDGLEVNWEIRTRRVAVDRATAGTIMEA